MPPETRRKVVAEYFKMYTDKKEHDTDRILAISQFIIYEFILYEISIEAEQRTILIQD